MPHQNMLDEELCQWLRDNSSGVYRPAAEAARRIEEMNAEIKLFNWMLKTRACVFAPSDRDGFACQFNTYHFTFGSTERDAIDKAMEEQTEQLKKAGYHENIRGADYYK